MDPTTAWQAMQSRPPEDRVAFAFRLRDQLVAEGWRPEPTEELATELDRRLAAHEADPSDVRTWGQELERIRGNRQRWEASTRPPICGKAGDSFDE